MTDILLEEEPTYTRNIMIDINDVFHTFCYENKGVIYNPISVNCDIKKPSINELALSQMKNYSINNQVGIEIRRGEVTNDN